MCDVGTCQRICEKRGIERPARCGGGVMTTLTLSVERSDGPSSPSLPIEIIPSDPSALPHADPGVSSSTPEQTLKRCA